LAWISRPAWIGPQALTSPSAGEQTASAAAGSGRASGRSARVKNALKQG
jgi:hypothetical protein